MHFADRLIEQIQKKGNPVCVGIDPRLDRIPEEIVLRQSEAEGENLETVGLIFAEFSKGIIDAVADLVPAVKPQMAFFEQYGIAGMQAFKEICEYAQQAGLVVIADGKRNDIGSTAEAYAKAYLGKVAVFDQDPKSVYAIDALTVTPYLGFDGIKPFTEACDQEGKGVFVLVKTSNPSSGDFQDRYDAEGVRNYEYIGHFVESWGADLMGASGYSSVGAVVGATYPEELKKLREIMPNSIFLVPGYGAQGGIAEDLKAAFNDDGLGALINASRSINYAYESNEDLDYKAAARQATVEMIKDLR